MIIKLISICEGNPETPIKCINETSHSSSTLSYTQKDTSQLEKEILDLKKLNQKLEYRIEILLRTLNSKDNLDIESKKS